MQWIDYRVQGWQFLSLLSDLKSGQQKFASFYCCSLAALLWFSCLVLSRPQRCSLPKECRTSPWAGDDLFHKVFCPVANLLDLLATFPLKCLFQASRLIHCCNLACQAEFTDHLKLLEALGMHSQWHGGSNWLDSLVHVEISLLRVWTSEECLGSTL